MRGRPFPKGHPWRFKPGQSGNPGGKPKTKFLTKMLLEILEKGIPGDSRRRSYAEALVQKLVHEAVLRGNIAHLREIFERVEGKVAIRLQADEPLPIELRPAQLSDSELEELIRDHASKRRQPRPRTSTKRRRRRARR